MKESSCFGGLKLVCCGLSFCCSANLSSARFCAAVLAIWIVSAFCESTLELICARAVAVFWLLFRNCVRLPGFLAPCSAPSSPPGFSEAAIDCWASFSQLGAVDEAMLETAMKQPDVTNRFFDSSHRSLQALTKAAR